MIAAIAAFLTTVLQDLAASTAAATAKRGGLWLWRRFRGLPSPPTRQMPDSGDPVDGGGASQASTGRGGGAVQRDAAEHQQLKDSTVFFSERFAAAFPGCRGLCEFNSPREALHRLDVLLQAPISAKVGNSTFTPVWWFRGISALPMESYRRERILFFKTLNFYFSEVEYYKMRRIAAVNEGAYFRNFVYVEIDPMPPTGLYPVNTTQNVEQFEDMREEYGEYGRFWKRRVTREEYDDGATIVNGRVKDLTGKAKLRVRMLSRYNFILAPHLSPVNNRNAESLIENFLDGILKGQATVRDLVDFARRLPRHRSDD